MRPLVPPSLAAVAAVQESVLTRRQLGEAGYGRHAVAAQVRARRWQSFGRRAVVLHNGELAPAQRWWVAVINGGPTAALAGRTAAQAQGLTGFEVPEVHVVVPFGTRFTRAQGVRVHTSRRYTIEDRHPLRALPCLRLERAVVDAAAWEKSPRVACGLLAATVQQGLTQAPRLSLELQRAGQVRHRRLLAAVLGDIAGGAQSLAEVDFGRLCRKAGLEAPLRQVVRRDGAGNRRYLDALLRRPDGTTFAVEIDGALHLRAATYWDDLDRSNELTIAGDDILRFPTVALYLDEPKVLDQLRRMAFGERPVRTWAPDDRLGY